MGWETPGVIKDLLLFTVVPECFCIQTIMEYVSLSTPAFGVQPGIDKGGKKSCSSRTDEQIVNLICWIYLQLLHLEAQLLCVRTFH